MLDVICLGILVVDVVGLTIDTFPGRGKLQLCDTMYPSIGGCAANTGIVLQKLGVRTGVIGKVGRDGFGDFVRVTLDHHGVDAHGVHSDEEKLTSATMVLIASDAERSFIHCQGANSTMRLEDIDWDLLRDAKILHIAGHFLMPGFDGEICAEVLRRAKELGLATSLDTAGAANRDWQEILRPALPHLDYFLPSYSEARFCTPLYGTEDDTPHNVARWFQEQGVGVVALKMGESGSYVLDKDGEDEWTLPAYSVDAVDATGAGDAFAAGFLAGVVKGYDLQMCARLGNASGAACVSALGTIDGVSSLEDTLKLMDLQPADLKSTPEFGECRLKQR